MLFLIFYREYLLIVNTCQVGIKAKALTDWSRTDELYYICAAFKSLNYHKPFIIGDGKHYGGYYNRPLDKHLLNTTSVHIGYVFENVSNTPDTSEILPTESRRSHAQAQFAGMHNNNSRITPVYGAFSRVCAYMHLTDAMSASYLWSTPVYSASAAWARDRLSNQNHAHVLSVFSLIYDVSTC